ncbi:16283_t:CDS:2 [Entrophospora sp. SA101]|nr:16283_t:CDS:2 [Entrophospora sp. SA101]
MYILDFFNSNNKKSEPRSINALKSLIIAFSLLLLCGIIALQVFNIINDKPIIQSDCSNFLIQPDNKNNDGRYLGFFSPMKNLTFKNRKYDQNALLDFRLGIFYEKQTYDVGDFYTSVLFIDSEQDFRNKNIVDIQNSFDISNQFILDPLEIYHFIYNRKSESNIISNWKSLIGLPPNYDQKYYTSGSTRLNGPKFPGINTYLTISPQTFMLEVNKEIRINNVLMSLGLIGGIWILISAIYGCLFGKDVIRPWGIIQKYFCCLSISTKHKLLDSFNTLPLVTPTTNYNDNQDKNDCLKKQIENLEEKLTALETFLGEYVVDPSYLKNLINQKPASKDLGGSKTTEVGAVSPVTSVNEYHQRASSILTTTTNITSPTMIINPNMMATPKVPTTSRKSLPPSSINNSSNNDNNWQIDII